MKKKPETRVQMGGREKMNKENDFQFDFEKLKVYQKALDFIDKM